MRYIQYRKDWNVYKITKLLLEEKNSSIIIIYLYLDICDNNKHTHVNQNKEFQGENNTQQAIYIYMNEVQVMDQDILIFKTY